MSNLVYVVQYDDNCPSCNTKTIQGIFAGERAKERAIAFRNSENLKHHWMNCYIEIYNGESGENTWESIY
jgi:predicted DCC family thiol-disulfide oxidoreductase YuxK